MMGKKRSVGIIITALYFFIMSVASLLISYFFLFSMGPFFFPRTLFLFIAFLLILVFLITGIGLLLLKNWARILGIIDALILSLKGLLFCYFVLLLVREFGIKHTHYELIFIPISFFIIPAILIICFLTRPKVKEQFK